MGYFLSYLQGKQDSEKFQMSTSRFEEIKMLEDESFNEFYAKFNNTVNSKFNLYEKKNRGLVNCMEDSKILA
jgi:hypothetical protein